MLLLFGPRSSGFFRRKEKPALFRRYQNTDGYQTRDSTQIIAFSSLTNEKRDARCLSAKHCLELR